MSVTFVNKDITAVTRGILAHGVNCKAVMGSGVALAIRHKWPIVYDRYIEVGADDELLGTTHIIPVSEGLFVANCYTQVGFGSDRSVKYADLEAVKKCIGDVLKWASIWDLPVYLPKIASDRGGLSWEEEVYPAIQELNTQYPEVEITVCLFEG